MDATQISEAIHEKNVREARELNAQEGGMTMKQSDFIYKLIKKIHKAGKIDAGTGTTMQAVISQADCGATLDDAGDVFATVKQASALIDWLLGQLKK